MLEIIKAIANGIVVDQGIKVGTKIVTNKRVTNKDKEALVLAIITSFIINSFDD